MTFKGRQFPRAAIWPASGRLPRNRARDTADPGGGPDSGGSPLSSWSIVLLAGLAAFSPLSIDMYLPSLPLIVKEFHAPLSGGQSTLSLFLIGLAAGQFFYGPASDRFGRKPLLACGIVLYAAASAVCAQSTTMGMLASARLAQGLGGCAGVVISRAVVADIFRGREAARALSLLMLVMGAAPVLAPLAGSMTAAAFGWHSVFWLQLALAMVLGSCALAFLPETRSAAVARRAREERPSRAYAALLGNRRFSGYVLAAACSNGCLLTYVALVPNLLINKYGVQPANVGWFFGCTTAVIIAANQLNRVLLRRYSSAELLRFSTLFPLAPAVALVVATATGWGGLWSVYGLAFFVTAPFSIVQSNAGACAFSLERLRTGSAAALLGAGGYCVGALAGFAASLIYGGSASSMAAVMLTCLCASALSLFRLAQPTNVAHFEAATDDAS